MRANVPFGIQFLRTRDSNSATLLISPIIPLLKAFLRLPLSLFTVPNLPLQIPHRSGTIDQSDPKQK
jgi:hypothetical protein